MDQGAKIAAAVSVILGGFAVAMFFRLDTPRPAADPAGQQPLVLRKRIDPQSPQTANSPLPGGRQPAAAPPSASRPMADPNSSAAILPPPSLARHYPGAATAEAVQWPGYVAPSPANGRTKVITHKIVDGDTLQTLAQRYLGSADRYREIYDDNRNVLSSPELLPIGKKLKIIPREPPAPSEPAADVERPMVPIER